MYSHDFLIVQANGGFARTIHKEPRNINFDKHKLVGGMLSIYIEDGDDHTLMKWAINYRKVFCGIIAG